jgi:transposase
MLTQLNLSEDEIQVLNVKKSLDPQAIIRKRCHAVYMKAVLPLSNDTIAKLLGVHRNSVDTWIKTYIENGLHGLITLKYVHRKSELDQYSDEIKDMLSNEFIQTTAECAHRIFQLTGVKRGLTQVRKFMHRLGFNHLKTGHIPAKADPKIQQEWKKKVRPSH